MNTRLVIHSLLLVTLISSLADKAAHARPKATPKATGTTVIVKGNQFTIDGGRISIDGRNLFYSFRQFDLGPNQVANFISMPNIENIFVEVSGGKSSTIEGLIQVSGSNSNLYLVNPAGVVFSPSATLNVPVALTVTTANSVNFSGQWWHVTAENNYAKLTGEPTEFIFSTPQPGVIINAGSLSTPNGSLTLWGNTVINKGNLKAGQVDAISERSRSATHLPLPMLSLTANHNLTLLSGRVQAEGDIAFLAGDALIVRDSPTVPTQIQSSGNLILQGDQVIDILVLNHPDQIAFVSNGNLSLLSNGMISGDSQFQNGGDFSIQNLAGEPTKFSSLHRSVILSDRNVKLGDYAGASLKVEAKGNIIAGNISINSESKNKFSTGNITITDSNKSDVGLGNNPSNKRLTEIPALILLAGSTQNVGNIFIDNIQVPAGSVEFKAMGTIITKNIDTSSNESGKRGGSIAIKAINVFTDKLESSSNAPVQLQPWIGYGAGYGNENTDPGGNISLYARFFMRTGDINTASLSGNGGQVTLAAATATVGTINTRGSTNPERKSFLGGAGTFSTTAPFQGGNVSVNTSGAFLPGAISTEGGKPGLVSISSNTGLPPHDLTAPQAASPFPF